MAMETVTNYKCDRCGRSEIKDGVKILTLTARPRAGKNVPGLGKSVISAHVCADRCVYAVRDALKPVPATAGWPKGKPRPAKVNKQPAKTATKGNTKKAQTRVSAPAKPAESLSASEQRAATVKAVRAITRVNGRQFAKGYNSRTERAMIAEREHASE